MSKEKETSRYLKNENIRSVEEKKNGEGKFRELFGERKCLLGGGK